MAEYIEKSAVLTKIDEFVKLNEACGFPVDIFDMEMLKKMIEKIPAADVAPVVRCKDCKLRKAEDCAMYCECECGYQFSWETDNGFCSWGQRKE